MSIPLAITTAVGVIMQFAGVYSIAIVPKASIDLGIVILLASVFVTTSSWQYFLRLGAHYFLTDQRVLIARGSRVTRELGLDNIESVFRDKGKKIGSWHVYFTAADGSDIDGAIKGKVMRWTMNFGYLWRREAERVEQLVKDLVIANIILLIRL